MNTNRIIALLLCLCMALSLVACGGSTTNNESASSENAQTANVSSDGKLSGDLEVGILLAEGTTGYNLIVENVGDYLTAANPDLDITFTFANSKARSFMEQKWRSETEAPDTDFMVYNAQVASTYEFTDKLLDLSPYLEQEGWSTYKDSAYSVMQMEDGGIYGLVTDTHVQGLYYNKAYFDQYNIAPPTTWSELLAACETLKANGIDPIAVTGTYNPYMGAWLDYLMIREVGYKAAYEGIHNGTLSQIPGIENAVNNCLTLIENDYLLDGFEGTDFTAAQMQFFQGKAGMILMGTWLTSEMADSIPDDFQLGIVAFPTIDGGFADQTEITSHANIISVNKNSDNLDAALAVVQRFTSVEVQTKRAEETGLISAVEGVPAPSNVIGLGDLMDNCGDMYVRHFALEFETDKNTAYYNEVAKLFMGEYKTAEEFLSNADAVMGALK